MTNIDTIRSAAYDLEGDLAIAFEDITADVDAAIKAALAANEVSVDVTDKSVVVTVK